MSARTAEFEAARPRLRRLAYRMLGSVAEAEDVVQDAWLRWSRAPEDVRSAAAWLLQTTARLAIDRLKSARSRRETYVGPWLPEPLIEPLAEDPVERAEEVSVAFLLALERLSPLERAVFLLHDVFDQDYAEVASALGRGEAACRQIAARAREHVRESRPRFSVPQAEAERLVAAFMRAVRSDDAAALASMLAEDAVLISDGGGKRPAALRPLVGREDILKLLAGVGRRWSLPPVEALRLAWINGLPGAVFETGDGVRTLALEPDAEGRLAAVYIVRNPDKLAHLARADLLGLRAETIQTAPGSFTIPSTTCLESVSRRASSTWRLSSSGASIRRSVAPSGPMRSA
jgi:RNA polymerase sigma-70 factor (ECF subfamily)